MPSNGIPFDPHTLTAYRKLAKHADKLETYYKAIDDVPTQHEILIVDLMLVCQKYLTVQVRRRSGTYLFHRRNEMVSQSKPVRCPHCGWLLSITLRLHFQQVIECRKVENELGAQWLAAVRVSRILESQEPKQMVDKSTRCTE